MPVFPLPLQLAIEIVNGWSESTRNTAAITEPPPAVSALAASLGLKLSEPDPALIAAWAEQLHEVFAAATGRQRLAALNAAIDRIDPLPVCTESGPAWQLPPDRTELPARLVLTLAEYARTDPELQRLGVCAAHRCVDAFADTTQARTRRYCSTTCQNRAKTAARRARMR